MNGFDVNYLTTLVSSESKTTSMHIYDLMSFMT